MSGYQLHLSGVSALESAIISSSLRRHKACQKKFIFSEAFVSYRGR